MAGRVAAGPASIMALPPPATDDLKYLPSVSIDPSPADYQQLQDLLQQALRREAEALKKIGHLHQQLESCVRSDSGSPRTYTPEACRWDQLDHHMQELSQTSLGSPQTPPPALVVSGSPRLKKSKSQPSTPIPIARNEVHDNIAGDSLISSMSKSHGALEHDVATDTHDHWNGHTEQLCSISASSSGGVCDGHLMPAQQVLSDVRKEREKPPTNKSVEHKRSTSLTRDLVLTSSITLPPSPSHTPAKQTGHAALSYRSSSPEAFSLQSSVRESVEQPPKSKSRSLGRASSIKNEKTKSSGHRSRSNSAFQMPGWFKKRRGMSSRPGRRSEHEKSTDSIEDLFLAFTRTATIRVDPLSQYIDHHWSEVCADSSCSPDVKKYREAVWDMFQSEAKYLTKFLQPLELVYKKFLEELHFHQILKVADIDKIFANLSELCELTSDVANNLFQLFDGRHGNNIAPVSELIKAFSMFGHKFNPVYQRFCINYEKQQGFVRVLQQLEEFQSYQSVCRGHSVVAKNDLPALLIAPMQHQCRYQLKLDQVLKYTQVPAEKELLSSTIKAFVVSLKELEANINEHKRSAELLELQETLYWPSVMELNPEAYVCDTLREHIARQPCCELLASKDRQLVDKGTLRLLDSKGRPSNDLNVYLFTDILLLTEEHRPTKKEGHNQLAQYKVFGHPMFLNDMEVLEVDSPSNTFTVIEKTLLQQRIRIYSLQTGSKEERTKWMNKLQRTQDILRRRHQDNIVESDV